MQSYKEAIVKRDSEKYLNTLNKDALVIYSPTSISAIRLNNTKVHMIDSRIFGRNVALMDALSSGDVKYDTIVSFGGGTATDVAKFISYKIGARFVCVPTMLSTNAFSTNKVALVVGKEKITLDAKLADEIILDSKLLSKASRQNLFGIADVLSIHVALKDWEIANSDISEPIDNDVYVSANKLLYDTVKFINKNSKRKICKNMPEVINLVGDSGQITNIYGTGRPESGSEHIFAKKLESLVDVPHGVSVSIGIILMSIIQDNLSSRIINSIKKIGTINNLEEYSIDRSVIKKALAIIKPRSDRYSILNRVTFDDLEVDNIVDRFEAEAGLKLRR